MTIRKYRKSDWSRICEIHDKSRQNELMLSVDPRAFLSLEQTAESEGLFENEIYIAEENGKPLGFVAFEPDEITWLYVHSDHYRKGIRRRLFEFAINKCSREITIEVLVGNLPAISLYESYGFKVVKRVKGKLANNSNFEAEGLTMQLIK